MRLLHTISTVLFAVLAACEKEPQQEVNNLNGDHIAAIGHGGAGIRSRYPINSREAVLKCIHLGADGAEIDVQLTADSVLVAFHDGDLAGATFCSGGISDKRWEEIKHCQYRYPLYGEYGIVSLPALLNGIPASGEFIFSFDCKLYYKGTNVNGFRQQYARSLVALVNKYALERQALIESDDVLFLDEVRKRAPDLRLVLTTGYFEEGFRIAREKSFFGLIMRMDRVTASQIKTAHSEDLRVVLWNATNRKRNEEAVRLNPDYIQTDNLDHLIRITR